MLKLKPQVNRMAELLSLVSFAAFIIIALLSVADVLMQRIFNQAILGAYELTEQLMLCAVFCAFAYGQTQKTHINMTLILARMPRVPQMALFFLMQLLSLGMSGVLTCAAGMQIFSARDAGTVTSMIHIPLWPFYIVECIAMAVFTLTLLYDTILSAEGILSDEIAAEIRKEWT